MLPVRKKGGWSLNDCLAKGPNLLELIPDIMLRFRLNKMGIVADIEKAFLQISVAKEDGQFLRFLCYTSSPFLLAATLKLHLEQYENEREVISLLKCMYMDNCVNSVTSLKEAQVFQQQSIDLLSPAGFNLREWQMGGPSIVNGENISVLDGFEQASLHVFYDASQDAYATCIYLRSVKNKEVNVQLFASKARVAPKKKLTIPKLELMSCLIGSRLTKQVMKIISESIAIPEANIWFWTDSSTALRWIQNEKPKISDQSRSGQHDKMSKEISVEEFEEAEKVVLRHIQLISFGRDDKQINKLNAFTDEYGPYRIKSQLYFGEDDYNTRCPIVLLGENQVVKLLIRKEHEMMSHTGIQTTQQLNESISIPATRITSTPAFGAIGVDLAGPLTETGGKKIWVVLYTSAVYRAVHLELTKTVSTEGFLDSFRRFVARRGRPSIVYSDNGLNFVGCNSLFKRVNWNDVLRYATVQCIKWNFNPPTAAIWGVWWERLVGLMKQLIQIVLGDKTVSYEELQTVICEVESAMNSRPLTAISEESGLVPITPAKFMCDNASCLFVPEADIVDSKFLKESHGKVQKLRETIRQRFRKEYLGFLRQNTRNKTKPIKEGDVVLMEVDNKKRTEWPIGVIEKTYPGKNGIVRVAIIKTKRGNFLRPVQ
ncbi:hypothetical protein LAZ67_X002296 [Cordylochernes scorpioides]|uniref:Integrase catalytic domain-containing protein n=1 Tax=Cordylochernes scorpioides TaxID=51811 RepID=A0ABY6LY59_9ARAC|nr:hypothetical protein LAZ67_X002296 [Cordylochernes scorpioides]